RNYVEALVTLAEQTRIVFTVNPEYRIEARGGPELIDLAAAVNRLAETCQGLRADLETRISESAAGLEEERNRLAALMSELSEGVMLCNTEGRILLYNEQAKNVFGMTPSQAPGARTGLVGLGRSI